MLSDVDLHGVDFSYRRLAFFTAGSSRFTECDFTSIRIEQGGCFGAGEKYTEYVDCVFDRARWKNVLPGRSRFVHCSFRDVRIRNFRSLSAEFVDCVFTGVVQNSFFNGQPDRYEGMVPNRKEVLEFRDNDFSGADLEGVSFRTGIDLSRQRLPEGPEYLLLPNAEPVLRRAWEIIESWPPEHPQRINARAFLRVALEDVEAGQRDIFRSLAIRKDPDRGIALATLIAQARGESERDSLA